MISKSKKQEILDKIQDKEQKIFVSNILDKVNKFEASNNVVITNFLDLNDISLVTGILNGLKVKYMLYAPNNFMEKKIIFFIPEDLIHDIEDTYSNYISCIKITPKLKDKLIHKDYMGSIYSLGIKREYIGDIFVNSECGYLFCMKSIEEYILTNLVSVSNQTVQIDILSIFDYEVKNLKLEYENKNIIVPSFRADAILSEIYNLSRSEVKEKIEKKEMYVNSKNITSCNFLLSENDIVSLKRCGKFIVGNVLKKTKSENIVLNIKKYK